MELFPESRVKSIKRFCLEHGLWRFDRYEKTKVLYATVLEETFAKKRPS
jgi:hypothetical protein